MQLSFAFSQSSGNNILSYIHIYLSLLNLLYIFYIYIYIIYIYYIYIVYIYTYIYIYIYIYTYTCNHENNVPSRYHRNEFVVTYAIGHMTYGYTLLLPMNQRLRNKLGKERNVSVIYYAHLTSVRFEPSVCRELLKWPLILHSLPSLLSTLWFIVTVPAICSRTSLKSVLFKFFLLRALFAPIMFVKMKKFEI